MDSQTGDSLCSAIVSVCSALLLEGKDFWPGSEDLQVRRYLAGFKTADSHEALDGAQTAAEGLSHGRCH